MTGESTPLIFMAKYPILSALDVSEETDIQAIICESCCISIVVDNPGISSIVVEVVLALITDSEFEGMQSSSKLEELLLEGDEELEKLELLKLKVLLELSLESELESLEVL
jgi:hypothetical protein